MVERNSGKDLVFKDLCEKWSEIKDKVAAEKGGFTFSTELESIEGAGFRWGHAVNDWEGMTGKRVHMIRRAGDGIDKWRIMFGKKCQQVRLDNNNDMNLCIFSRNPKPGCAVVTVDRPCKNLYR